MESFEFNNQLVPQSLLSVDDLGECAIEATNDEGYFYYLVIRTSLGMTTIAKCGPVVPDVNMLPDGYATELVRMKYDGQKLGSVVNKWLNDKKKLTEAKIITIDEALEQFRDLGEYMKNYSEEVY